MNVQPVERHVSWRLVRIGVALLVMTALFPGFWRHHLQSCSWSTSDLTFLYVLLIGFSLAFVLLIAEGVGTLLPATLWRYPAGILLGVAVYCGVGGVVWLLDPTDGWYTYNSERSFFRRFDSAFWGIGVVEETGSFHWCVSD